MPLLPAGPCTPELPAAPVPCRRRACEKKQKRKTSVTQPKLTCGAIKWLGNIQPDKKWYLMQGAPSGDIRCMFLSPNAVGAATVCNIDDIATRDEFREYFTTYGPIIFASLKHDKKTLNQRGHGGAAANLAKDMGWESVMQATNADRAERIMGSM